MAFLECLRIDGALQGYGKLRERSREQIGFMGTHFERSCFKVLFERMRRGETANIVVVVLIAYTLASFGNQHNFPSRTRTLYGGGESFLGLIKTDILRVFT